MSGRISHLLWDWNGTLLDDAWLCIRVVNSLMGERSLGGIDLQRYRAEFDFPVINYYRRLGFELERESFEDLSVLFINRYLEQLAKCRLQPGVRDALEAARRQGLVQGVLSAAQEDMLHDALRHFGIESYFSSINGIDTIHAPGKLERGRRWLEESGLDAAHVLLVGDTVHDHEVARDLGMQCVLVANGHHSQERLRRTGAPVIADLRALPELLTERKRF